MRAETFADQTCLTIEITEREDSGNYKIVLQNEAGEATANVKVKVVGERQSLIHECAHTIDSNVRETLVGQCMEDRTLFICLGGLELTCTFEESNGYPCIITVTVLLLLLC